MNRAGVNSKQTRSTRLQRTSYLRCVEIIRVSGIAISGCIFVRREMTLTESATRSGLQIPFEASRITFGGKLHRDHEGPGSVVTRASGRSAVVPLQASINVRGKTV
jgi:hypothetical protein